MSYTKYMINDFNCNYLDLSKDNSEKMLLSCINFQNYQSNVQNNNISGGTLNGRSLVEGFTSDMSLMGGVSYVPQGECPVGFTKVGDQCQQVCRSCKYTDKDGYFGTSYVQTNNICGSDGTFNGFSENGFINCKLN